MAGLKNGSLRLFRAFGIDVYLHWSWAIAAFFLLYYRIYYPPEGAKPYGSNLWIVLEYLTLFAIVLLHEFGHALACRQVGGTADTILLWPLGGVAFVQPPPRPGAFLWSLAAGPLVNVVLLPITVALYLVSGSQGWDASAPDLHRFLEMVAAMNFLLLFFNLLPIYPLDGGQILQSLLWFVLDRPTSLMIASALGFVGGLGLGGLFLLLGLLAGTGSVGLGLSIAIAGFVTLRSLAVFQQSRLLMAMQNAPRRDELACPSCNASPPAGDFWTCEGCRARYDLFAEQGFCPECSTYRDATACPDCYQSSRVRDWWVPDVLPAPPRAPEKSGSAAPRE